MGKVRKTKEKKDEISSNPPRKPMSSYMEFCSAERSRVREELGPLSLTESGKELGKRWKELSKEEKSVYELKAEENRRRFVEE